MDVPNLRTIPFWSDYFDYHGLRYTYKMVGTDPKRGSATTVIPVEIIPIRWVFYNGMVVDASTDIADGQTPVQGIINSPIFHDYDFTIGGTHVGNTQYGDAFQRANFWNSVSTRSRNYHVRLGQPTVMPTQTVIVPEDQVEFYTTESGFVYPSIDSTFVASKEIDLISSLGIAPESLPIVVWGSAGSEGSAAYHTNYQTGSSIQTYISTSYLPGYAFGYNADVSNISHEIIEWYDDPFGTNFSPGWSDPFYIGEPPAYARCDSYYDAYDGIEVADPFEWLAPASDASVDLNGFTYHLAEGAFIDFFTRNARSRSVNGQYSFFEVLRSFGFDTPPSRECIGGLHTNNQFLTVPGSSITVAYGMNNTGSIVGYFRDQQGYHAFVKDRSGYTPLDYPGAAATIGMDINDGGTIIGYFYDASGYNHGFSYKNDRFTRIDFPGAIDTLPEKINSGGVISGAFNTTQPVIHGFVLSGGKYEAVNTPFGSNSEAAAVNDAGTIAGNSWTQISGPQSGFLKLRNTYFRFDFPDATFTDLTSINTFGDLGGFFYTSDNFEQGMVRLYGYPYAIRDNGFISDINDRRQVVGWAYNFDAGEYQAFVGQPSLANVDQH